MNYKVGDRVKVKSFKSIKTLSRQPGYEDRYEGGLFTSQCGVVFQPSMRESCGLVHTIDRVSGGEKLRYHIDGWWWPSDWVEDDVAPLTVDEKLFEL